LTLEGEGVRLFSTIETMLVSDAGGEIASNCGEEGFQPTYFEVQSDISELDCASLSPLDP
jgi:hypothetical protein